MYDNSLSKQITLDIHFGETLGICSVNPSKGGNHDTSFSDLFPKVKNMVNFSHCFHNWWMKTPLICKLILLHPERWTGLNFHQLYKQAFPSIHWTHFYFPSSPSNFCLFSDLVLSSEKLNKAAPSRNKSSRPSHTLCPKPALSLKGEDSKAWTGSPYRSNGITQKKPLFTFIHTAFVNPASRKSALLAARMAL